jgi:hypothetical protein
MRAAGQDPTGEGFQSARDTMMRDAVANPEKHSIKFMGERVPFEGQNLEQMLSEPDVAGEQAAIDSQFGDSPKTLADIPPPASNDPKDVEEFRNQTMNFLQQQKDMTPQDKLMSEIMDEKGNLKPDNKFMDDGEDEDDMPPPEEEDDRPKSEDELLERVMAQKAVSHIRGFRDAWSVLKS